MASVQIATRLVGCRVNQQHVVVGDCCCQEVWLCLFMLLVPTLQLPLRQTSSVQMNAVQTCVCCICYDKVKYLGKFAIDHHITDVNKKWYWCWFYWTLNCHTQSISTVNIHWFQRLFAKAAFFLCLCLSCLMFSGSWSTCVLACAQTEAFSNWLIGGF